MAEKEDNLIQTETLLLNSEIHRGVYWGELGEQGFTREKPTEPEGFVGLVRPMVFCPRFVGGSVCFTVGNWQWVKFRIQGGWEAGKES